MLLQLVLAGVISKYAKHNLCWSEFSKKEQHRACAGVVAWEETYILCFLIRSRIQLVLVGEQHTSCADGCYLKRGRRQLGLVSKARAHNLCWLVLCHKKQHTTCVGWCVLIGSIIQLVLVFCHKKQHTTYVAVFAKARAYKLGRCFSIRSSIQLVLLFSHEKQNT